MAEEHHGGLNLLKFDGPFLVYKHDKTKSAKEEDFSFCRPTNIAALNWKPDPYAVAICEDKEHSDKTLKEILNTIVSPVIWEEDGKIWKKVVSSDPASRNDILHLQEELAHGLKIRQARLEGICPIRRELFAQAFDELIRQVTTNCPERGLLLLRVRDEMKMTTEAYKSLHDASAAYGLSRPPGSDAHKRLNKRFTQMDSERRRLEVELASLQTELGLLQQSIFEQRAADDKRHFEKMQFLKRAHQFLRKKLEALAGAHNS